MSTKDDYYDLALVNILKANPSVDFIDDELDLKQALLDLIDNVANKYSRSRLTVLDDLRDMQIENRINEQEEIDLRPGPD